MMSLRRSLGTFIMTYFLSWGGSHGIDAEHQLVDDGLFIGIEVTVADGDASLFITTSTSLRLLWTSVEPELTISKMASASPMPG